MSNEKFNLAATELIKQRLALHPITPLPESLRPQNLTEAYAIQAALNALLIQAGMGSMVGHKIGCTTPVMQAFVNIDQPCAGRIFSRTVMHGQGQVPAHGFVKLGIECEIAVVLAHDLPAQSHQYNVESVKSAVGAVMIAMELVDERYAHFPSLGVPTLVADDFFNAGCILGEPVHDWHELDLANLTGFTRINGREVAHGKGSLVMGHPLHALAWLANSLAEHGQPGLKAGEFVLLGSVVETQWLKPGDRVEIDIPQLGELSLEVIR